MRVNPTGVSTRAYTAWVSGCPPSCSLRLAASSSSVTCMPTSRTGATFGHDHVTGDRNSTCTPDPGGHVPATKVHFNGSVNLADTETVMREIASRVPAGVSRIPDGETGDRSNWFSFQLKKFAADPETREARHVRVRRGGDPRGCREGPARELA